MASVLWNMEEDNRVKRLSGKTVMMHKHNTLTGQYASKELNATASSHIKFLKVLKKCGSISQSNDKGDKRLAATLAVGSCYKCVVNLRVGPGGRENIQEREENSRDDDIRMRMAVSRLNCTDILEFLDSPVTDVKVAAIGHGCAFFWLLDLGWTGRLIEVENLVEEKSRRKPRVVDGTVALLEAERRISTGRNHSSTRRIIRRQLDKLSSSFSRSTLSVPSCHATRRKHDDWDTDTLPKPIQERSRCRSRVRVTDPPCLPYCCDGVSNTYGSCACKLITAHLSAGEVTELAGDLTIKAKRKLLTPRNIMLAIANDEELQKGFSSIVLPFSGVVPRFNKAMLSGKPSTSRSSHSLPPQRSNAPKHPVAPVSVLSQRIIAKQTTLCVVRGSVTNARGDVVVHPTASSMSFSGQVGSALLRVGGQGLASIAQESYDQHGPLELDGVRLTHAVGLGCPYVLHCNSPSYNSSDTHQSVVRLTRVIEKCLEICDANNLRELVLPSVGSGGCHYPKQLAAETILRAIKTYCDAHFETTILTAVYFVLYDQESISVYTAELARLV
ncbi:histone H2A [Clonorchis sinensis]|uniref:Histone H2A n=1 Tax=Clonorchis sinensis TaxID=79923 RepID=G7Y8P4_CLOSI|nr:histone H2A [Clonorchis sinensis]